MASGPAVTWNVIILASKESLQKIYSLPPDTYLSETLAKWQLELGLFGNWIFKSENGLVEFDIDSTLQDIGESIAGAKMVVLRAELSTLPTPTSTKTIHLFMNGETKRYSVKPHFRLKNVIPITQGMVFEYNGEVLNINRTIEQLGIKENGVISVLQAIDVELSNETRRKIHVAQGSSVCNLKQKVMEYERSDFKCMSNGRILNECEPLLGLTGSVNVYRHAMQEFKVSVGKEMFHWEIKEGIVKFGDFIARLFHESGIDRTTLSRLIFVCKGCRRRICQEEEDFQSFNIDCCRQRSLILKTEEQPNHKDCGTSTVSVSRRRRKHERKKMGRRRPGGEFHQQKEIQTPESVIHSPPSPAVEANQEPVVAVTPPDPQLGAQQVAAVPFYLRNRTHAGINGRADLQLPQPTTVGDVRIAVSNLLGIRPESIKIEQHVAVLKGGKRLFYAVGEEGRWFWTSADGERIDYKDKQVNYKRFEVLQNDQEPFILSPGRRLHLEIQRR